MVDIKSSKLGPLANVGQNAADSLPATKNVAKGAMDQFSGDAAKLKNKGNQFLSGAFKVFGDGVTFPGDLLDTNNPANNAKYLRLLAACIGMDELEWHFKSREEAEQQAYIERKEKRRQERINEREGESSDDDAGDEDDAE